MIHRPPPITPAMTMAICTTSGGAHCIASAAEVADSAPIRSAPSPPMMTMPSCAGSAVHSAVRMQRRGAGQRVLPGEPGAERALVHIEVEVERVLAEQRDEDAEHRERADQRRARDQDVFDARTVALEEAGIGGRGYPDRLERIRRVSCHEVAPITPSTR